MGVCLRRRTQGHSELNRQIQPKAPPTRLGGVFQHAKQLAAPKFTRRDVPETIFARRPRGYEFLPIDRQFSAQRSNLSAKSRSAMKCRNSSNALFYWNSDELNAPEVRADAVQNDLYFCCPKTTAKRKICPVRPFRPDPMPLMPATLFARNF
jgi:hypothetical protein